MTDGALLTEEEAKAAQEVAKLGQKIIATFGQPTVTALSKALAPAEPVIGMLTDWLRTKRERLAADRFTEGVQKAIDRGEKIEEIEPDPKTIEEILRNCADVSDPDLSAMWSDLLATAMQRSRMRDYRSAYSTTLRQFSPIDALIMSKLLEFDVGAKPEGMPDNRLTRMTMVTGLAEDEVRMSLTHLEKLDCIWFGEATQQRFHTTPFSRSLFKFLNGNP